MRILLFTDANVFAGTERHMLDLATSLRDLGVSAQIACPSPSPLAERAAAAGIGVIAIPKKDNIDFAAARTLRQLLKANQLDLIHAHNGRTHIASAIAIARAGCGALVSTQHFLTPARADRRGIKALVSSILHRFAQGQTAHTIAISNAVRDESLRRGDSTGNEITVVHNGIPAPSVNTLTSLSEVRASLNLPPGASFILCAARLQKEKDISTLISAMFQVSTDFPDARCFIAGEGDQHRVLQTEIEKLNLTKTVTLLGFRSDVLSLMNACDVFVLPSLAEPFGLVLLEAMALAKPCIATRAGGPLEIIDDTRTGFLVEPSSPSALANAIGKFLADPGLRQTLGKAARARYEQHFTAARMARETLAVYRKALQLSPESVSATSPAEPPVQPTPQRQPASS